MKSVPALLAVALIAVSCGSAISQAALDEVSAMSPERIAELTDIWCSGVARWTVENPDHSTEQQINGWLGVKIHESLIEHPEHLLGLALLGKHIEEGGGTATPEELEVMRAARRAADDAVRQLKTGHPNRGRAPTNQDWYRRVAQAYLGFYQEHGQRAVKELAEDLDASPNKVSWWVRRAREEGWLTKGHQGRAGASPGPRLIEWQKAQEEE